MIKNKGSEFIMNNLFTVWKTNCKRIPSLKGTKLPVTNGTKNM